MATVGVAVATMKASQVTAAGAGLKVVELGVPVKHGSKRTKSQIRDCRIGLIHARSGSREEKPKLLNLGIGYAAQTLG